MRQLLVTGATGRIGSQLAPRLAARDDVAVRALVRSAEKAAPLSAHGVTLAFGTFESARDLRAAVQGVDTVVLLTAAGPEAADQAGALLAAAKESGVRKVVRLSVFRAAVDGPTEVTRLHGRSDNEIRASGLAYTIVRPPFFMQNLLFMAGRSVAAEGKLYFGIGRAKVGMIDARDVVDCLEHGAISDAHEEDVLTITGPESVGFDDVAGRLSTALGRPVEYVPVPPEAVERSIRALGLGDWYAGVMGDLCRAYGNGFGDVTTDAVARLTGHPPRPFDAFAREVFAPAFARDVAPS